MNNKQTLIVGCGLTGSVIANILANAGESVIIIDKRNHIGGNAYDYKDSDTGITVHKYGPHIFHTNNQSVWDYLSRYTGWNDFMFEPLVMIDGKEVNLPFNLNSVYKCFPENIAQRLEAELIKQYGFGNNISIMELLDNNNSDLKLLAGFIYSKVFQNYTKKQWGVFPEEIDKTVIARVPVRVSNNNYYFEDKYQGIPVNGYTALIKNLLSSDNIEIKLNTDYKNHVSESYKRIIYTGSIDEYFNYKYGKLPYRSLRFDIKSFNMEYYQNSAMVNYPNENEYTRITEHKYFLGEKSKSTVVSFEYPTDYEVGKNECFYPILNSENVNLYNKYTEEAKKYTNLYFIGRLGNYRYYNMDTAVSNAMNFANSLLG